MLAASNVAMEPYNSGYSSLSHIDLELLNMDKSFSLLAQWMAIVQFQQHERLCSEKNFDSISTYSILKRYWLPVMTL